MPVKINYFLWAIREMFERAVIIVAACYVSQHPELESSSSVTVLLK
jgi:hypothetical protein